MHEPESTTFANLERDSPDSRTMSEADPGPPGENARSAVGTYLLERLFSFPSMLASLLIGGVFVASRAFRVDPDLWWHIKVGETILKTHQWPTTDVYSFTVAGQPWLAYEWLGDIVLATANSVAGLTGLEIILILVGSSVVLALYSFATLRTGNSKAGFIAAATLSILAVLSFSLRPQMLGYLFLILTLIALERFRQGKRGSLWLLPLLMLVWVNTHGSWIVGLGTISVHWMSGLVGFRLGGLEAKRWMPKERRSIACVYLLSLLAVPITPYGTRIAASPFEFAFSLPLNVAHIQEWQPMPFDTIIGKVFLGLLIGVIIVQVTLRLTWRLEEFVLFLIGLIMASLHIRFILVFVPFVTPVLGTILANWVPPYEHRKDKFVLNAALIALTVGCIVHYFPSSKDLQARVARAFPVSAVAYLQQHPVPGPMFNNYGFGGYLVWSRGPKYKVFIDGRGDVYERGGVLSDYMHISYLEPGALAVLRGYGVRSCLLEPDAALATALSASAEWKRVYIDGVSALFVRTTLPETIPRIAGTHRHSRRELVQY
jgi:hypothetical protein